MISNSTIMALIGLKIQDAQGHLELFPDSPYHRGCKYVAVMIKRRYESGEGEVTKIVGLSISASQAILEQSPFDRFHKGAHDTAVNLLRALKFAQHFPKPADSDPREPIDKTKF